MTKCVQEQPQLQDQLWLVGLKAVQQGLMYRERGGDGWRCEQM